MSKLQNMLIKNYKEIGYQILTLFVLFMFFSYNQEDTENFLFKNLFAPYKFAFFGNYIITALIISYILIPELYYKNKPWLFLVFTICSIASIILIDELILEKVYFPYTRGTYFPGIAFTLIETLPLIIIMVGFKIGWDINKKQREIELLKMLVKESELQFLKSQINPHFLFNNLNNLYYYALEGSPKTVSIILELSSVLRYMLYDCKEDFVPLSKEIIHLKNYTALNELQIENRGTVNFSSKIENSNYLISPLVLVVFVENAFKHSTSSQSENISIDIYIEISS
jgi:sensor histidine kinase YesM